MFLSESLSRTLVLAGDGTDAALLKEERARGVRYSIVVASEAVRDDAGALAKFIADEKASQATVAQEKKQRSQPRGRRRRDLRLHPHQNRLDQHLRRTHGQSFHHALTLTE